MREVVFYKLVAILCTFLLAAYFTYIQKTKQ